MDHTNQQQTNQPATAGGKISAQRIDMVRRLGTDEQIQALEEELQRTGQEQQVEITEWEKTYRAEQRQPAEEPSERRIDHIAGLVNFMHNRRNFQNKKRPPAITEKLTRRLLWEAYCQIVYQETKINLVKRIESGQMALSDSQKNGIKNMAKWLIGENGPWPIDKSLYLWGPKGAGKTTLLQAAYAVSAYFKKTLHWNGRHFQLASLYQTFLDIYTAGDLKQIKTTSSGWWALDDLRPEHTKYKHFGNDIPVLALILISRHDAWKLHGHQTILVGNMHPQEFKDIPGLEYDKIAQQFFTIEFDGPNFRKPKNRL